MCSVDASKNDKTLGRLVNDDHISPNCEMKKIVYEGKPHLCLFAVEEIPQGKEITYNYGSSYYSWRPKVFYIIKEAFLMIFIYSTHSL